MIRNALDRRRSQIDYLDSNAQQKMLSKNNQTAARKAQKTAIDYYP